VPLQGAQKSPASALGQRFTIYAALEEMGSQLPFAACSSSGYYADKVAVRLAIKRVRSIVVADADFYPSANGPPE